MTQVLCAALTVASLLAIGMMVILGAGYVLDGYGLHPAIAGAAIVALTFIAFKSGDILDELESGAV